MPKFAVLFDIDGTLIDSNYLHVEAWARAFHRLQLGVDTWRIHRGIGADADTLLDIVIAEEPDGVKDRAKALHADHYQTLLPRLRLLPGARELITALAGVGARVVLATSAPANELGALQKVLGAEQHIFAVTSGEDVEQAKPNPELITIAREKAGVTPDRAIMVGDSVWDIEAAARAGVRAVGLRSGGTGAAELREAGAIAVYDDAADLLQQLSASALAPLWS